MGLRLTNQSRQAEAAAYRSTQAGRPSAPPELSAKRIFDIVAASAALIVVMPVMLVVALLIKLQDGGKAIYWQQRYGLNGETFNCFKLRSMVPNAKQELDDLLARDPEARAEWNATQKLTNDPRITKIGHFVRKTSIDELPQLFNILRGDMSLVGPRPIVENEISKYGSDFEYYCSVRPGLTGLWQVKGRSDTSYDERVALDVEYVQTRTFWGDIGIALMTIPAVIMSKGAR